MLLKKGQGDGRANVLVKEWKHGEKVRGKQNLYDPCKITGEPEGVEKTGRGKGDFSSLRRPLR